MLITEQLFLLFTRENGWSNAGISHQDMALSAGLFSDLVFAGVAKIEESNDLRNSVVHTLDPAPDPDKYPELIVSGYKRLTENPDVTVAELLRAPWFAQKGEIARSLSNQGIITIEHGKFLGVKWEKFPTINRQPEDGLRKRLAEILKGDTEATVQETMTLIILGEVGHIKVELRKELNDVTFRDVNARVREIGEKNLLSSNEYTSKAVRQAVNSTVSLLSGSAFFMS